MTPVLNRDLAVFSLIWAGMIHIKAQRSLCVFLIALMVFGGRTHAQQGLPAAAPRRILFVSERNGNREIYAVNDDGTGLQNLTNNPADDAYPVWSPDGTLIAFQSNREGNWGIYWMTSDGRLRGGEACCDLEHQRPSWYYANPRDPSVVYQTREDGRSWDIGISSEALSGILTSDPIDEVSPIVSPNNQLIAFRTHVDDQWQLALYVINDWISSEVRLLTPHGMDVGAFAWSPDSQHIAFERNGEIYVIALDGSFPPINLTLSDAYDSSPAWSPAGSQIAYVANWEIYVMDAADGTNPYNLSQNPAYDVSPAWSPDAQQIAFASYRDENWEIYVMDSDGCNVRRLTDDEGWDGLPQWQPQPSISPISTAERPPTAIITTPNANLRNGPGENYAVIATAVQRECLTLVGRNADGTWLQIQQGETSAWVSSSIVEIVGDINRIPITEAP